MGAPEGSYRPPARALELWVRWDGEPRRVLIGKEALAAVPAERLGVEPRGWARTGDGFVVVKLPDRWEAFRITIE